MKSSLLQSLFDEVERQPLSVSQLTGEVKSAIEARFASVWVEGEITNFTAAASGHWYFTLRDEFSQLKAACYRGSNLRIRFQPFDGLQVRVRGKLSVYEPKGEYQILVEALDPVGEGALLVAFEQTRLKLEREGLFAPELKRPLPFFPRRVGVITSPTGAAIHDILTVLSRRTRTVDVLLIPTRVQGETAASEIVKAVELANAYQQTAPNEKKIDVLIVGRGGGSLEDLWAFNDERVARAVRASEIPIISAVGHEIDFTILDFVADQRAATPSAAAEIVAAQESQIAGFVNQRTEDMRQAIAYRLLTARSELQQLNATSAFNRVVQQVKTTRALLETNRQELEHIFERQLGRNAKRLDRIKLTPAALQAKLARADLRFSVLRERLRAAIGREFNQAGEQFGVAVAALEALSPLAVLGRGYSIVRNADGAVVRRAEAVKTGDEVAVRLAQGALKCRVLSVEVDER